jgi:hypothetical protein
VYKIYKQHHAKFLQYNELNGSQNLKEWRNIAKSTLNLKENTLLNLSKLEHFCFDLSKIITPEPGAIYRVGLFTRKIFFVQMRNCG